MKIYDYKRFKRLYTLHPHVFTQNRFLVIIDITFRITRNFTIEIGFESYRIELNHNGRS